MEENATRAIMIGVGLFIVLLTITGVLLYVNAARSMATVVDKGLNSWDDISYNNIMDYNGDVTIECTGIDLINFIRKYVGRDDIYLSIVTDSEEVKNEKITAWKSNNSNNASEEKLSGINADSKIIMKKTVKTDFSGVNTYYVKVEYRVDLPANVRAYESKENAENGVSSIVDGAKIVVENDAKWIYYKVNYSNNGTLESIKLTIYANDGVKEIKEIFPDDIELDTANRRYIYAVKYENMPVNNAYAIAEVKYKEFSSIQVTSNKFNMVIGNGSDNQGNIVYGDVTGDGKVGKADSLRLQKYLAGWDVQINEQNADINGDGKVSKADLLRLQKYLAGWDVTLGPTSKDSIGDVNGDGVVNNADLTLLKQYLDNNSIKINKQNSDINGDGIIDQNDVNILENYLNYENTLDEILEDLRKQRDQQ